MRIADFDYELPEERIAQKPVERRDQSRLMVLRSRGGEPLTEHRRFDDLIELLEPGDVLVLNDARVLPARLWVRRSTGGRVELLFLDPVGDGGWRVLARPARRVRPGERLTVAKGVELAVVGAGEGGERVVRALDPGVAIVELLESYGRMPLPPYIKREMGGVECGLEALDRDRYQTVYAATPGAVASPTAGLHFTDALLRRLRERGIQRETLTLRVGAGTFRPVAVDHVEDHSMDAESYRIAAGTAERLNRARREGRRVIAVGTTSVRTLEHAWTPGGIRHGEGSADLFIMPGYRFRAVDGMITNFHLPRSTPMLMVSAMIGRERLLAAYREAIADEYRFYSYGDAMLVLPDREEAATLRP